MALGLLWLEAQPPLQKPAGCGDNQTLTLCEDTLRILSPLLWGDGNCLPRCTPRADTWGAAQAAGRPAKPSSPAVIAGRLQAVCLVGVGKDGTKSPLL